ncbi:LLM class flavin-dependent oxidoreductase [Amycolatopsis australiensis]|uniref:Flavin-dependent oxidoreductase, luciferase family (Includes alkanesulfonate monooxygenase SsuD and methylene tetrahydromethanopterin reductase) n=1 Tax=Amycolatopsis australiensis TaxID=546364 RepID=A0A1K1S0S4_9PSEU|nr:LLM class flavin-dependent oxidoreductase [Amycolatopsis australiensis]SFW77692.1 Flavin-dependent oxidoreductase, luciferase family (includes alkanesulfonate monooxygenase SsuD and methylene tetrahydromethanopterin reductase) [Amycolatopsis australiensis]
MTTVGLKPPQQHVGIAALRQIWAIADDAGFDGCWVFDHLAPMGADRTGDIFDGWTLLAAMAEATRRVRIGCLVSGNTNRHPGTFAKIAVTVDHLSGGRLDVGLGAGGDTLTDAMMGTPTPPAAERVGRLAETCEILGLLWTRRETDYRGRYYTLTGAVSDPKPVQAKPPLWLGSSGEKRGLRVVAEHADVWLSAALPGTELAELQRLSRVLDEHCAAAGRDPATIRRAVQFRLPSDADGALRLAESYVAAGFTELVLMPGGHDDVVKAAGAAADLLPRLRDVG